MTKPLKLNVRKNYLLNNIMCCSKKKKISCEFFIC